VSASAGAILSGARNSTAAMVKPAMSAIQAFE
jgi:hypothetical protein